MAPDENMQPTGDPETLLIQPHVHIRWKDARQNSWDQSDFHTLHVIKTVADLWRVCCSLKSYKCGQRVDRSVFLMKHDVFPRWEDPAFKVGMYIYSGISKLHISALVQECLLCFCAKDGPDGSEIKGMSVQRKGKDSLLKLWCDRESRVAEQLLRRMSVSSTRCKISHM